MPIHARIEDVPCSTSQFCSSSRLLLRIPPSFDETLLSSGVIFPVSGSSLEFVVFGGIPCGAAFCFWVFHPSEAIDKRLSLYAFLVPSTLFRFRHKSEVLFEFPEEIDAPVAGNWTGVVAGLLPMSRDCPGQLFFGLRGSDRELYEGKVCLTDLSAFTGDCAWLLSRFDMAVPCLAIESGLMLMVDFPIRCNALFLMS
ncbi:hypothetical protein QYF36_001350 [Acer negundo]|nr:hypothetical protein QYF36_001350 [Acer negundo]